MSMVDESVAIAEPKVEVAPVPGSLVEKAISVGGGAAEKAAKLFDAAKKGAARLSEKYAELGRGIDARVRAALVTSGVALAAHLSTGVAHAEGIGEDVAAQAADALSQLLTENPEVGLGALVGGVVIGGIGAPFGKAGKGLVLGAAAGGVLAHVALRAGPTLLQTAKGM